MRPAHPAEAAILAEMANDLNDHVGIHGRPFTPERIRADGFGPRAAFTPLVAELDGAVVGYVFFSAGYSTDVAARSVFLHDIFVASAATGCALWPPELPSHVRDLRRDLRHETACLQGRDDGYFSHCILGGGEPWHA